MSVWSDKHIPHYIGTFGKNYLIFDVSNCREATITRLKNALHRHDELDTATVDRMSQNGKSILIRTPTPIPQAIYVFRKDGQYAQITIPQDRTFAEFIEDYFTNDFTP